MTIRVSFCAAVLLVSLAWPSHSGYAAWIEPVSDSHSVARGSNGETTIDESTAASVPAGLREVTARELLARVRFANELLYSDLQNFVCSERIDRYKGPLNGADGHRIDTITSMVSFENGVEHYTEIRQNNRSRMRISNVSGAWSEGEFGTLLRQTQALLGTQLVLFRMNTELNQAPAMLYRFDVSEEDSPWDLEVESKHYHVPFHTDVWVSPSEGRILKIERTSTAIPLETRISEVRWSIGLETVELNGKSWLLPKTGEYAVLYEESQRREWNLLSFSDYHRYGSQVALSFETK